MAYYVRFDVRVSFDKHLQHTEARDLHRFLRGSTVFDLRRGDVRPLFISTLLHGNETSGWDAIRRFVVDYPEASIVLFIGNVQAAAQNMRHLPHEVDFNRIWRQEPWQSNLSDLLTKFKPWCGIDVHNNSGPNPHYSVVTDTRTQTLALATLFSNKVIFTDHTLDILAHCVSFHCPALTIEVGTVEDPDSEERAYGFLKRLNQIGSVPDVLQCEPKTYATIGIVKVEHENGSLENYPTFHPSLKQMSFKTLRAGTPFVNRLPSDWEVNVSDPSHDHDLTDDFLEFRDQSVFLKRDVVMSMFTHKPILAVQDCVCYFLKSTSLTYG